MNKSLDVPDTAWAPVEVSAGTEGYSEVLLVLTVGTGGGGAGAVGVCTSPP